MLSSGNSLRQTVHIHRASVHQAAKLIAALLRVARVTAGLAKSNWQPTVGFMTHVAGRLTAKNRDQFQNPKLGNVVWATFYHIRRHRRRLFFLLPTAKDELTSSPALSSSLPFLSPPSPLLPLNTARGSGERCKTDKRFGAYWSQKRSSGGSSFC